MVTQLYGLQRATGDVDVLSTLPPPDQKLIETGRRGSELHKKYGIYLDVVTVASLPYNYEQRLKEMFPGIYPHLRLPALDPYDLALTKLSRNIERDREDVKYLARTIPFDLEVLQKRYQDELLPYMTGNPSEHDLTMELWIQMIQEERDSITSK